METLTIELKQAKSMALLEDLEALDIIKIIQKKHRQNLQKNFLICLGAVFQPRRQTDLMNTLKKVETNGNEIFELSY